MPIASYGSEIAVGESEHAQTVPRGAVTLEPASSPAGLSEPLGLLRSRVPGRRVPSPGLATAPRMTKGQSRGLALRAVCRIRPVHRRLKHGSDPTYGTKGQSRGFGPSSCAAPLRDGDGTRLPGTRLLQNPFDRPAGDDAGSNVTTRAYVRRAQIRPPRSKAVGRDGHRRQDRRRGADRPAGLSGARTRPRRLTSGFRPRPRTR